VKKVVGGETTVYVGNHFEKNLTTGEVTKSYTLGGRRVAMRRGSTLTYLHGDHLGSASMTTNALGGVGDTMRYYPYGEARSGTMATDRRFTGQREETVIGLYDYKARYYDPVIGRFIQADTIVPDSSKGQYNIGEHSCGQRNSRLTPLTTDLGEFVEQVNAENHQLQLRDLSPRRIEEDEQFNTHRGSLGTQTLNRYTYGENNPLLYIDPTGHSVALSVILVSGAIGGLTSAGGSFAVQMMQGEGTFSEKLQGVDWGDIGIAAGVGFGVGALAPVVATTTAAAALLGSGAGMTQYGLTQWSNSDSVSLKGMAFSGALGGVTGGIGGPFNAQPGGRLLYGGGQQFTASEATAMNGAMQIQFELLTFENVTRSSILTIADNWDWIKQAKDIIE
jgi:RHS repeat-associated protein